MNGSYVPTSWQDGVTKLGPTNLNKIENGIFSAALVFNVKDSAYGAKGDGVTDDTAAIQAAINIAGPIGATVYFPPGTYIVSSTLLYDKSSLPTGTASNPAPSLVGAGGGIGWPGWDVAAVTLLKASASFPVGEFMIDFLGGTAAGKESIDNFTFRDFGLECGSRAAGIRVGGENNLLIRNVYIDATAAPSPANSIGSPTGAISLINTVNQYRNTLENCIVNGAGQDGYMLGEGDASMVTAKNCVSLGAHHYGFTTTPQTYLIGCESQTSGQAGEGYAEFNIDGTMMVGCHTIFPGDQALNVNNSNQCHIVGCQFYAKPAIGRSAAHSAVAQIWGSQKIVFAGCSFLSDNNSSYYIYVNNNNSTGSISFSSCHFGPYPGATFGGSLFNLNGVTSVAFSRCSGLNPLGSAVTQPAVPTSTTTHTNDTGVDCTVFVNGGTVSAVAIGGTATGQTSGAFRVPAGQTITLTYTSAPTWTWFGD